MVLDFEYGINTGNRFLDLVDHDEDPDEFIANQTHSEEKPKKSSKESKSVKNKATNKTTAPTPSATLTTKPASANVAKTNKENLTGKSINTDQRRQQQQQQSNVLNDNNNQQIRVDSGRGGRGYSRRGGSAGQDRPPYEGSNRGGGGGGGGQQRSQRFYKFDRQENKHETSGFEQNVATWDNVTGPDNQTFSGYRGRGRGGPRRGNFERGRDSGRGRGRFGRGRGNFNNRNFEEGSQEQQQTQDRSEMQQTIESSFENTHPQSTRTVGQEFDTDVSGQELRIEPENVRRGGGRGSYRSRVFRHNRNYADDRQNHYEREGGEEGGRDNYRYNRRQHDRQPRSYVSSVKPVEKRDGEGAHNWGNQTEIPADDQILNDIPDTTDQTATAAAAAAASKGWAQQVDEAEKQMTLDEYKKQLEAKKQAHHEKVPQFNRRAPNEGVDPKEWQKFEQKYRKKNDDEESNDEENEEGSGDEENESEEDIEEENISGKKKIITIPLRFKPIEFPRGSRGGLRRGTSRYQDRPYRDDQRRSKSPSQQQLPSSQQTGEYHNDEQPRSYHGGSRQGSGRGEFRRIFRNSTRGGGGGHNRLNTDSNTPDLANAADFPTLPKQ
ncbi:unnamed protein product [Rotaria sp. Silwood1]|nr:unnamed protein product [Rotaria sp. Silwood1]CAF3636814.1 unnamed protein product [Rotaria sp. Silwood1]CAF4570271.1 unnamed protein product [Rotaria sp. Silwood1]CAF4679457.1 unnamed protein product [Rotaria sp. Silwood1]